MLFIEKKHLHPQADKKLVVQHAKGIKPHTAFKINLVSTECVSV